MIKENVLIAYNDDVMTELHDFFESCADDAKQFCSDSGHAYTSVCTPNLSEQNVILPMKDHSICFIAAHGSSDGIFNENEDDIISTHTTNYDLNGKTLYAISCSCAKNLMPELKRIGLVTFVGYNEVLRVTGDPIFRESAMEGLKALLLGNDKYTAKQKMLDKYSECIEKATSFTTRIILLHNREHLCFE